MVQDILQDAVTCVMDVTFQKIVENPMRQKKMDVQITTILSKDGFYKNNFCTCTESFTVKAFYF